MPELPGDLVVHRLGGKALANLRLRAAERKLKQPGISVLLGDEPGDAAERMLKAFPDGSRYTTIHRLAKTVASTTVQQELEAGFVVVAAPTAALPTHGRIVHALGAAAFDDDAAVQRLADAFEEVQL